jgi:hypothetical protein
MSPYLHKVFTLSVFDRVQECIYNIYKASFRVRVRVSVRVRVTLQLTVSQSVCLDVEPNLGLLTRDLFFFFKVTALSFGGACLTRGRVCPLSVLCQYSLK